MMLPLTAEESVFIQQVASPHLHKLVHVNGMRFCGEKYCGDPATLEEGMGERRVTFQTWTMSWPITAEDIKLL